MTNHVLPRRIERCPKCKAVSLTLHETTTCGHIDGYGYTYTETWTCPCGYSQDRERS